MCFVLTQAKYVMPMTEPEETEAASDTESASSLPEGGLARFDKAEIRSIILGAGGRILQAGGLYKTALWNRYRYLI